MALRALGDPSAADDVAQETLARGIGALRARRVADPAHPGPFFRGIARHVIADHIRRDRATAPLEESGLRAPTPDALDALVDEEERARLRAALDTLSPGDREILGLSFFDGVAPREISARLGEPPERIRKRKSRALERLRRALLGSRTAPLPDLEETLPSTAALEPRA